MKLILTFRKSSVKRFLIKMILLALLLTIYQLILIHFIDSEDYQELRENIEQIYPTVIS